MFRKSKVVVGERVQVEGFGLDALFRGRIGTVLGYSWCGRVQVRLDDAAPWEASISAERDEATGRPIVFLSPEGLCAGA
jgi:hypothetical protein